MTSISSISTLLLSLTVVGICACGDNPPSMGMPDASTAALALGGLRDVPMRDGVTLRTWTFAPEGRAAFPMFVVRNPYVSLNDDGALTAYAKFFTDRGIGLVWQAVRGTGGSGGSFVPYVSEIADGSDTIAWLAAHPASNGRFGTGGGSYLGYTAWATAAADARVKVVLSDDTAADEEMTRHGGAVDGYLLSWWSLVERNRLVNDVEQAHITNDLDLTQLDEAVLGRDLPYWNDLLAAGLAEYPAEASLITRSKTLCVPALHIVEGETGWRDPVRAWDAISQHGCAQEHDHQWLVVAPEPHATHFSAFGVADTWVTADMMRMLETFLLETAPAPTWARVRYRPESTEETRSVTAWPPSEATESTYYLSGPELGASEGGLAKTAPSVASWTLKSDPAGTDPCAASTETWFTSAALPGDLVLAGAPRVTLQATTDSADFDVLVELYDYHAASDAYRTLGSGAVRARLRTGSDTPIPTGQPFELVIALTSSARRVPAGHQLTLSVAPSRCGHAENPNAGEPLAKQTKRRAATVAMALGPAGARLMLPTVP